MDANEKKRSENNKGGAKGFKRIASDLRDKLSEKGEREVRERLRRVVNFALTVGVAYLLGLWEAPFSAFPLSLALICSARKHLIAVSLGILLASFSGLPETYGFTCVAIIFVRVLIALLPVIFSDTSVRKKSKSKSIIPYKTDAVDQTREEEKEKNYIEDGLSRLFSEKLYVKELIATSGGLLCGVFLMIADKFSFYSLITTLILTASAPLASLALGGVYGEEEYKKNWYSSISIGAVIFFALSASAGLKALGMPMAPCLAMLITLYVCSGKGIVLGCGAALVCSLAFDPTYAPLLVISAALFCLISAVKRNAGIVAVCAIIVVWCYYIGGERGLLGVLPPMLLAIPIYMVADKYREMMNAPYRRDAVADGIYFATAVTEKSKNEAVRERLSMLSDTFSSLSDTFYTLSNRFRRSDALGIRKITDSSFEKVCEGCRNRERCWGSELSDTLEAIKRVTACLHTSGAVTENELPEKFASECIRLDKLIAEVNGATKRITEDIINGGRANFFATNYDDITAILKDALNNDSEEYECDLKAGDQIYDYLCSKGIRSGGVVVYGKRCAHVVAKGVSGIDSISGELSGELSRRISEILGCEMGEPAVRISEDGNVMLFSSKPKIKASCAHGRLSRSGKEWSSLDDGKDELYVDPFEEKEETCGDMTDAFITDNSYFYSLISDGMGSGAEAAYTSGVSAMFIQKMLTAGNRADTTIRMLNNVIRSENTGCGSECSATVDLLELDLMSGTAAFIKSGAAPTYIAREGTVYKISSRTMPVGIIKDADARITKFDTKKGDIIVMMSDGCCHDSEDCPWLVEYLCAYMTKAKKTVAVGEELCERLKEEILREAVKNAPEGEERDDISVSVTVVG